MSSVNQEQDLVSDLYEPGVVESREWIHSIEAVELITSPDIDSVFLDRFLIEFTARGVQMTEPVEGWIRRAGLRTVDVGFTELGEALQRHAVHEKDHHLMMIADTGFLVEKWNSLGRDKLDADQLIAQATVPGTVAYVELHEAVIAGETPYAQLGIEYEIEKLSLSIGAPFMKNVINVCGADRTDGLTFIKDHVELDVGHTEFNLRQLNQILDEQPGFAKPIADAGSKALQAYGQFLTDCLASIR